MAKKQKEKKKYCPVPFAVTDKRIITLSFNAKNGMRVYTEITQLDLQQMHSNLKGQRLRNKIERYIKGCDEEDGIKTDLQRKIPRRNTWATDDGIYRRN